VDDFGLKVLDAALKGELDSFAGGVMGMNTSKILARYVDAATAHGLAYEKDDTGNANRQAGRVIRALHALDEAGNGRESLLTILDHPNPNVRCWAATHLLNVQSSRAVRVLERLAAARSWVGFNARMTLELWREGTLEIP
jgi:hypothetical protein